MKILYVLNSSQPGGMEHHVFGLVEEMTKRGHEVFVWCPAGPLAQQFRNADAKVTVAQIKSDLDLLYTLNLSKFLKTEKIDILHAHEIKAITNSIFAGFLAGTKVRISHTHTPISEWTIPWFKKVPNLIIQFFVVRVFVTKEMALTQSRKKVKIKEGLPPGKLVVIPNGVKIEDFALSIEQRQKNRQEILGRLNIPENPFIFGNVGRISEEKGHKVLLDAFSKVTDTIPNAYLLIAGGGSLEQQIEEKTKELGLDGAVKITGRFSFEDQKKYFSTIDCFVHPTFAEGFGIVALEAMASELPLLVSNLEVLREVCSDTATYFETGNSSDLGDKMRWAFKNPGHIRELAVKAKELVKELYSMQKFGDSYEKLYFELAGQRKRADLGL